ncbi:MAG: DMT family transporter [Bacteroidales bacterium]|jgi:drug/metabolite transporter (DMT)-like permease|nr:DMT family transporter [Bacteroidales bacterium]
MNTRFFHHLLALAVVAVWGVTFVSTKTLISAGLDPAEIFLVRFLLAYTGIWVLSLTRKGRTRLWSRSLGDELLFVFLGMSGGSFYFLTENTALAYTQAGNVSFLVCSAPLFTAIFSLVYRRLRRDRFADAMERVGSGWMLALGTMLALGGMALMLFDGQRVQVSLRGDLLALGAALCWALYSLFMGKMTEEYGAVFATRKVFAYGLLTILPFLIGRDFAPLELFREPVVWGNLLFLGLIASLACFMAWNLVMSKLGNITSVNYVYLNPVFTLISAMIILGERLTPAGAVGSALILLGVILAGRRAR